MPFVSMELLRIYGSVTQAAESYALRATSPGLPAGDGAALLFGLQCRPCNSTDAMACSVFPEAAISSSLPCKQDLWRNHPLSLTAEEFWRSMTRTFISLN